MNEPYEPGTTVVIRHNPHHAGSEGIAGTVVGFRPGAGFAGCDLVAVEYEDTLEGCLHVMPFAPENLSPGDSEALLAMARRHESIAAKLRRLAGEETL